MRSAIFLFLAALLAPGVAWGQATSPATADRLSFSDGGIFADQSKDCDLQSGLIITLGPNSSITGPLKVEAWIAAQKGLQPAQLDEFDILANQTIHGPMIVCSRLKKDTKP